MTGFTAIVLRLLAAVVPLCFGAAAMAAGFDETINSATAPIAEAVGKFVFFKVPVFGAQLPLVVLWLVAGAVIFTFYTRFIAVSCMPLNLCAAIMPTRTVRAKFPIFRHWQLRFPARSASAISAA